jgi:hypothetical protein
VGAHSFGNGARPGSAPDSVGKQSDDQDGVDEYKRERQEPRKIGAEAYGDADTERPDDSFVLSHGNPGKYTPERRLKR